MKASARAFRHADGVKKQLEASRSKLTELEEEADRLAKENDRLEEEVSELNVRLQHYAEGLIKPIARERDLYKGALVVVQAILSSDATNGVAPAKAVCEAVFSMKENHFESKG